jgi:RES domain-containing protein
VLSESALRAVIPSLPSRPLRDTFLRCLLLRWTNDPLGKNRPLTSAGRFHLPRSARVLYLAGGPQTAGHEVQAFGAPLRSVAILPVQVNLNAVLDLTDPGLRKQLGLTPAELAVNFRASKTPTATQILGELCAAMGVVDALLYPSVAHQGGECLAVLETSLATLGSWVEIDDASSGLKDRLP